MTYRGFLWGFGVVTPDGDKTPGQTILEVLEVVDSRYRVQTGGFVGDIRVDGGDGGDSNGVGCWLNGWVGCWDGFQNKM